MSPDRRARTHEGSHNEARYSRTFHVMWSERGPKDERGWLWYAPGEYHGPFNTSKEAYDDRRARCPAFAS